MADPNLLQSKMENFAQEIAALEREQEKQIRAAAEAAIVGEPFDLGIFPELEGRLLQLRAAFDLVKRRFAISMRTLGR